MRNEVALLRAMPGASLRGAAAGAPSRRANVIPCKNLALRPSTNTVFYDSRTFEDGELGGRRGLRPAAAARESDGCQGT
eukprot:4725100-Pyramimonas_sp.AAC.1